MISAMFVQVIIQAFILRLLLLLIAKHEADTSFAKLLMVTAGISVGIFFIDAFLMQFGPFVTVPLQIALITAMIMSFCWLTFWKSLLVVVIYAVIQFLLTFLLVLALGALFKGMVSTGPGTMPGAAAPQVPPSSGDALVDLDALLMASETGGVPVPTNSLPGNQVGTNAPGVISGTNTIKALEGSSPGEDEDEDEGLENDEDVPLVEVKAEGPPVEPVPVAVAKVIPIPAQTVEPVPGPVGLSSPVAPQGTATSSEWAAARKRLRIGGSMVGAGGYYAMIDGKVLQQGETVTLVVAGQRFRWKVTAISKERVDLKPLDAVLVK